MTESKNQVSARHKQEWQDFRDNILAHVSDTESAKYARAWADILKIYQEGERRAQQYADGETDSALDVAWQEDEG